MKKKDEIPQLSEEVIVKRRKTKINNLGFIPVDELGFTCRCCEHFATAKTPRDHVFRKMWAWKRVSNLCPCPHLNEKEPIKGNLDASQCPYFKLNKARINPVYFEEIKKTDNGEIEGKHCREDFFAFIEAHTAEITEAEAKVQAAREALAKAKEEKKEMEDKRNFEFITRYTSDKIPQNLSSLFGVQLGSDYQTMLDNKQKIADAGYDPNKIRSIEYTITSQDVGKIIQSGALESLGFNKNGSNDLGNSVGDFVGQKLSFETLPYKVVRRGAKRMVIFRETDKNYLDRKEDPFYRVIFSADKIQWRLPVIEKPTFDMVDVTEDEKEDEENDFVENKNKETTDNEIDNEGEEV